jgi:ABC-type transport system involved in multi-copper enzyme maturation permease subunit
MWASFTAELLKLRKRPATWLIAGVWVVLTLVFGYVFPYFSYNGGSTGPIGGTDPERVLAEALPAGLVPAAVQGFPMFAGALALLLGALAAGSEYQWQTMKTVLTQGPRRSAIFAGKALALTFIAMLLVLVTFVVDAGASWLIATITDHPAAWPPVSDLVVGFAGGGLVVTMWCLGGLFLGILLRGTTLAVGFGLVWALAVENLVRAFAGLLGVIDDLQRFMPGTNAGALVAALGVPAQGQTGGTPGVTDVVGGTHAAVVLAVYVVFFVLVAGILLNRRDVA